MTTTFCTSGAVKLKAGANVSTALTDTNYTSFINHAENYLNDIIKLEDTDLVTKYSSLNSNVKLILEDAASSYAAIEALQYDPTVYSSRTFETLIDINYNRVIECANLLKNKQTTDFILDA